jgi:hypothetical protein
MNCGWELICTTSTFRLAGKAFKPSACRIFFYEVSLVTSDVRDGMARNEISETSGECLFLSQVDRGVILAPRLMSASRMQRINGFRTASHDTGLTLLQCAFHNVQTSSSHREPILRNVSQMANVGGFRMSRHPRYTGNAFSSSHLAGNSPLEPRMPGP